MVTLFAVLAMFLSFVAPALARPSSADAMREVIKECDATTNGEDSIHACEELIRTRRYKGHLLSMIYNNVGTANAQLNNYERAIEAYSDAIRADPRYIYPRVNRAKNLAAIARFSDAILDMDAAIKLANTAENYALRADFRNRNSDLDGALGDYSAAIKLQPKVAVHYNSRGAVYAKLSKHVEAIEDFSRAIQLNPRDPSLYAARGLAWHNAGKCDQAIPDYTKAIAISPRFSFAYNNRGVCNIRAGKRDEAIADYEAALKWEPGNELARQNLAGAKNAFVPPAVPTFIEVPKFDVPAVKPMLEVPEFSVDADSKPVEEKD
jgi:tetratricopeptide (TPR) repeat protein